MKHAGVLNCSFLFPTCAKTHALPTIFPGFIPGPIPLKRRGRVLEGRRDMAGREIREGRKE
jgi:hypothetical protein